jgi:hypothetical protein
MTRSLNSAQLRILGQSPTPPLDWSAQPANPYQWIREWWGDELTPELATRMSAAPREHRLAFADYYLARALHRRAPAKIAAELRPYCDLQYSLYGSDAFAPAQGPARVRALALYCHQIVIEDPVARALMLTRVLQSDDEEVWLGSPVRISVRDELSRALTFLLDFQPLANLDVIIWTCEEYHAQAMNGRMSMLLAGELEMIGMARRYVNPDMTDWGAAFFVSSDTEIARLLNAMHASVLVTSSLSESVQLLVPNRITEDALDAYCRCIRRILPDRSGADRMLPDRSRTLAARQLISLGTANLVPSAEDIVRLRGSSAEFADWRLALSQGLREVAEIPEDDDDWILRARGTMHEALAAPRERLRMQLAARSLESRAQSVAWSLCVSGIGGAAAAAVGGNLVVAAASSVGSAGASLVTEYLRNLNQRREGRALLSHYVMFDSERSK